MTRRSLVLSPEVSAWLQALGDDAFGRVCAYLDLLRERGGLLAEPHSQPLRGPLRLLVIPGRLGTRRLVYTLEGEHTVVLLTVWRRWRRARAELRRATATLHRQPRDRQARDRRPAAATTVRLVHKELR
jgi:mRNA-degrading endonuclease RelE of RelBE toxin-antitoxin system